jgi:hypothetical protein
MSKTFNPSNLRNSSRPPVGCIWPLTPVAIVSSRPNANEERIYQPRASKLDVEFLKGTLICEVKSSMSRFPMASGLTPP